MSSQCFQIAEAVATELNALPALVDAGVTVTALHAVPSRTIEELSSLDVTAVPMRSMREARDRGASRREYEIGIGLRQHIDADSSGLPDAEQVDDLLALAEAIADYRWPDTMAGARWLRTEHDPPVDDEALYQSLVFISVISLTFVL